MKNRFSVKSFFKLSAYFFALFVSPAMIFHFSFAKFLESRHLRETISFKLEVEPIFKNIKRFADHRSFWGMALQNIFYKSPSPEKFLHKLQRLEFLTGKSLRHLVFNKNNQAVSNNLVASESLSQWCDLRNIFAEKLIARNAILNDSETYKAKKLLGPHFLQIMAQDPIYRSDSKTIKPDFSGVFPDCWYNCKKDYSVFITFPENYAEKTTGLSFLRRQLKLIYKNVETEIIRIGNEADRSPLLSAIRGGLAKNKNKPERFFIINDHYIYFKFLDSENILVAFRSLNTSKLSLEKATLLFWICYFSFFMLSLRSGLKDLLLKISIRNTVISLLLMANAIPAIVLIIVSIDNYAQTKRTMLKQKHAEQISYMQSIEENLVFEHSRLLNNCLSATRYLEKSLSEHVLNHTMVVELKNRLGQDCNEFYIVASSANLIGSNIGFFDGKKFLTVDEKKSINDFKQTIDAMKGVGYLFLVLWNKIAANDPRKIAETEIIIESLFQAPVHEVFQSFLGFHDNLSIYNWGSEKKPVYLTTVYGKDRSLANYLLIAFFDPNRQVLNFIRKHSSNVRRNLMGSQLFFGHPRKKNSDRQAFGLPEKLYPLVFKAQTYPTFEPEIVSIDSEEFVFSGVTCKYPFRQHLIALYPLNLLEKKLNGNLKEMILVTILAIILVLSISGLFLHGIIIPLRALNQGAVAMQAKNFSYRLPDMGTDELGEMAGIFNRNMEDLEEMQAAGIVQNSIMPTTCFERDTYSLYGKSIVLAGLGGDYFDYFEVKDEQKTTCSIMMGDVAGHGVGAALLMTMAKTAVQFFQNFSREPVQMVQSLHKLIHSTRTKKQKKIMTFQFLSLDSSTLSARYSNAGACSPILVNPSKNMAREISLAGPALGAFKKSEFKEIELKLEPGDALILYTDGIAEAKSSAGKTLGYDRLAQLLLQCWSGNAESYYQNIVRAYENWLDGAPPEDDLTIIVLVIK